MSTEQSKWILLAANKGVIYSVATRSNVDKYIIIKRYDIWKYNFKQDEWSKIFDKQNNFPGCSAALNGNEQKLSILSSDGKLAELQLNDISFNIINDNYNGLDVGGGNIIINYNNRLNVIGGNTNDIHWKWNEENKTFTKVAEMYNNEYLTSFGVINDKKTNCLLLFGGYDCHSCSAMDHILEFNTENQKWNTLQISLPMTLCGFGCTLALHGKYVVIFGGLAGIPFSATDTIYIYDIKNKTINKSKQKCPHKGCYSATTIHNDLGDEKAVFGYVRRQWNISNIDDHYFPPFYILNIIKAYFYNEYIYLLDKHNGNHYKINTFDII